jgi:hypothetical protein
MLVMWWNGIGLGIFLKTSVLYVSIPPGAGTVRPLAAAVPGTHCHHNPTAI